MKIAIIGYGKMGHEIEQVVLERGHQVIVTIDNETEWSERLGLVESADVAIEFSHPSVALGNIRRVLNSGIPLVCGTTGWYAEFESITNLCNEKNGTFFYATNFSIGVNLFMIVNKKLAQLMNAHHEYDVVMEETHHIYKADAPSGTAITLAEDILANNSLKTKWTIDLPAQKQELYIHPVRHRNTPGIHSVCWESPNDIIEITHTAKGRRGLAMGAVIAAEWIKDKKGIYTMKDLLNL
ncbi:MAG: 4-hydroxy-tetrahydrodipicolinate reductase [Bacteroidota bacterium]|nr:4-hydroxy-tetrahydrodipicolinate reductase [Bacteroidota bacterium]